jgi:hypothetical protein
LREANIGHTEHTLSAARPASFQFDYGDNDRIAEKIIFPFLCFHKGTS